MLRRFSIKHNILILILPILCFMALLIINNMSDRWRNFQILNTTDKIVRDIHSIGNLIHEVQKERAQSALYIGSKGTNKKTLEEQRVLTDKAYEEAKSIFNGKEYSPALITVFKNTYEQINLLINKRQDIIDFKVTSPENFQLFSTTCEMMIDLCLNIIRELKGSELTSSVLAYVRLLQAKEFAGQERANGTVGFSIGKFEGVVLERFFMLIAKQEISMRIFLDLAPQNQKDFFTKTFQKDTGVVENMRDKVRSRLAAQNFEDITSSNWIDATTTRINLMKEIENAHVKSLLEEAKVLVQAGTISMILWSIGFAILILSSVFFFYFIFYRVSKPLSEQACLMKGIASGESNLTITLEDRNDEIGEIGKALFILKDVTEKSLYLQSALEQVGSSVVILSPNGEITYFNTSAQKLFSPLLNFLNINAINDLLNKHINQINDDIMNYIKSNKPFEISIGSERLSIASEAVFNKNNETLGFVLEWKNLTEELKMQDEIQNLVTAAVDGDLTQRINAEDKTGFTKNLSEGMNELLQTVHTAISEIATMLSALSQGNLSVRIHKSFNGVFGQLKDDANKTSETLQQTVKDITFATDEIISTISEFSASAQDLSCRTEQQASTIEETAASMEELSSTVKHNAENSMNANQFASDTRNRAEQGGNIVTSAIEGMQHIQTSSEKISNIISVIDEIAFQTNLLALNAAVEAARAGETGKGFAVVAEEVRNLAQRSSNASKEIKGLILESNEQVISGVELVNKTGGALKEIVAASQQVAEAISEISTASSEQSAGIDQINIAISQMDEITQRNAAIVQRNTQSVNNLEIQAKTLKERINFFRF